MKKILCLCFILLLIACHTHMNYPVMTKTGVSEQQRRTDALDCKKQAIDFKSKAAGGIGGPIVPYVPLMVSHKKQLNEATEAANEFYVECMEERGYKWE